MMRKVRLLFGVCDRNDRGVEGTDPTNRGLLKNNVFYAIRRESIRAALDPKGQRKERMNRNKKEEEYEEQK